MTNKKNNQGFKEDIDSLTGKRTLHCIAAEKGKFKKENVSKASAIVPVLDEEDIITLRYENSDEFADIAEEFEKENDIELVMRKDEDEIFVDVPVENSADFIEYMNENEIKVKEDIKAEKTDDEVVDGKTAEKPVRSTEKVMVDAKATEKVAKKDVASVELKCTVDKIIDDAQSKRSKRALTSDKLRTAKKVGDKENAFDLMSWLKNPGKTDLKGVDDAE